MSIAPGWYPDPADTANMRYWDGEGWADHPCRPTADLRAAQAEKAAAEKAALEKAAAEAKVVTLPPGRAGRTAVRLRRGGRRVSPTRPPR